MTKYAKLYETIANKAIAQGELDIESFIARMRASGMGDDAIIERLADDFENNGPIFGKFVREITGAATKSTAAAVRQGERAAMAAEFIGLAEAEDIFSTADEDDLEELAAQGDRQQMTWVATMVNTCERCLPLHGVTMSLADWTDRGLLPETMHDGWSSECQCQLVPADDAEVPPLRRVPVKTETGLRVSRKTLRGLSSDDIDTALKARDEALKTIEGRRMLRLAGRGDV